MTQRVCLQIHWGLFCISPAEVRKFLERGTERGIEHFKAQSGSTD
jgi:hypothetical protein